MKRTILAALAALATLNVGAAPRCFPLPDGGHICDGGLDAYCAPPLVLVWLDQDHTRFQCVPPPFKCEVRVIFERDQPQLVKVVPDASCSSDALRSALAVAAAKISLGQGDVFAP